jgi:hypothetical protein
MHDSIGTLANAIVDGKLLGTEKGVPERLFWAVGRRCGSPWGPWKTKKKITVSTNPRDPAARQPADPLVNAAWEIPGERQAPLWFASALQQSRSTGRRACNSKQTSNCSRHSVAQEPYHPPLAYFHLACSCTKRERQLGSSATFLMSHNPNTV